MAHKSVAYRTLTPIIDATGRDPVAFGLQNYKIFLIFSPDLPKIIKFISNFSNGFTTV